VDQLAGRHGALDGIEEADELLMPVALHAASEHRAVDDIERGEECGDAIADIIVMGCTSPAQVASAAVGWGRHLIRRPRI
jgi:hypothetical protein